MPTKPVIWFKSSTGLNNKIDPVRAEYRTDTGIQELSIAENIDFDSTGRVYRRKGWETTVVASDCHSLFSAGGQCLVVSGTSLCSLDTDFALDVLRTVTSDARMRYCQVGGSIYYSNGSQLGYVKNNASHTWEAPPDIRGRDTTRQYLDPPLGTILAYHNGRLYIVQGNVLWFSEQYGVTLYDTTRNYFQFESDIRMVHPVKAGLWVSTENAIYFLAGTGPKDFLQTLAAPYPAIEGTDVLITGTKLGDGSTQGTGILWLSTTGIHFGSDEGVLVNLTSRKLLLPDAIYGAGVVMGNRYVVTLEAGVDGSRLGICLSTERIAPSQYTNYNFNSMCSFRGRYLGANENGVFVLGEADVDGSSKINSKFKVALTDFGTSNRKRIRSMLVGFETDGRLKLSVSTDEGAVRTAELASKYEASNRQQGVKVPIGRDGIGRYWSFQVENIDGADFSVDEISAILITRETG